MSLADLLFRRIADCYWGPIIEYGTAEFTDSMQYPLQAPSCLETLIMVGGKSKHTNTNILAHFVMALCYVKSRRSSLTPACQV